MELPWSSRLRHGADGVSDASLARVRTLPCRFFIYGLQTKVVIGVGVPGCVSQPANEFAKANEHYRLHTRYKARTTEQHSLRRQHNKYLHSVSRLIAWRRGMWWCQGKRGMYSPWPGCLVTDSPFPVTRLPCDCDHGISRNHCTHEL